MSIHWFQMLSDQEIERLNQATRKMQAEADAMEIVSPLCADGLCEGCPGQILGQPCACECHHETP